MVQCPGAGLGRPERLDREVEMKEAADRGGLLCALRYSSEEPEMFRAGSEKC